MSLWTAAEAAAATAGQTAAGWAAEGISIDTRTIRPGDLFVALSAARDGHDFVAEALARGAAAALVSRVPAGVAADAPLLIVPDVAAALVALGQAARARTRARVLAITGSMGKTSTKDMAAAALSALGRVHAAEASLNNHWGVPLTLARMPADTDFAVLEIGMNHPGEIEPLARMARPHVAMITTVAPVHLEAFADVEGIAREKAAVFAGLAPMGAAIIPEDLAVTPILRAAADAAGAVVVGFGEQGAARPLSVDPEGDGIRVRARILGQGVTFHLGTAGRHFAMNAVGALAALDKLGADLPGAAEGLSRWRPYAGRGAVERMGGVTLLDDSYNANPTSLAAGLATLAALGPGRRVAILGDMLELGPDELAIHRDIASWPAMAEVALVHACGPRMRGMFDALPPEKRGLWSENAADLGARAADLVQAGDLVIVKGSKFSRVASVVEAICAAHGTAAGAGAQKSAADPRAADPRAADPRAAGLSGADADTSAANPHAAHPPAAAPGHAHPPAGTSALDPAAPAEETARFATTPPQPAPEKGNP